MIAIGERPLDLSDIRAALAGPIKVELSAAARARIVRSAETVKRLLATGDADSVVLPRNTQSLAARLRAADNAVQAVTYGGIGHREILGAFAPGLRFLAPVRQDVLRFVTETTA